MHVYVFLYVYVYVLYELFFSIDNVVCLLSYVNMYACHVYFTVNFLTYLLHMHVWSVHICLCVSVHVCFSICSAVHAH